MGKTKNVMDIRSKILNAEKFNIRFSDKSYDADIMSWLNDTGAAKTSMEAIKSFNFINDGELSPRAKEIKDTMIPILESVMNELPNKYENDIEFDYNEWSLNFGNEINGLTKKLTAFNRETDYKYVNTPEMSVFQAYIHNLEKLDSEITQQEYFERFDRFGKELKELIKPQKEYAEAFSDEKLNDANRVIDDKAVPDYRAYADNEKEKLKKVDIEIEKLEIEYERLLNKNCRNEKITYESVQLVNALRGKQNIHNRLEDAKNDILKNPYYTRCCKENYLEMRDEFKRTKIVNYCDARNEIAELNYNYQGKITDENKAEFKAKLENICQKLQGTEVEKKFGAVPNEPQDIIKYMSDVRKEMDDYLSDAQKKYTEYNQPTYLEANKNKCGLFDEMTKLVTESLPAAENNIKAAEEKLTATIESQEGFNAKNAIESIKEKFNENPNAKITSIITGSDNAKGKMDKGINTLNTNSVAAKKVSLKLKLYKVAKENIGLKLDKLGKRYDETFGMAAKLNQVREAARESKEKIAEFKKNAEAYSDFNVKREEIKNRITDTYGRFDDCRRAHIDSDEFKLMRAAAKAASEKPSEKNIKALKEAASDYLKKKDDGNHLFNTKMRRHRIELAKDLISIANNNLEFVSKCESYELSVNKGIDKMQNQYNAVNEKRFNNDAIKNKTDKIYKELSDKKGKIDNWEKQINTNIKGIDEKYGSPEKSISVVERAKASAALQ